MHSLLDDAAGGFNQHDILVPTGLSVHHMQILEERTALYFHLHQQHFIELVRQGQTQEALEFAQENLAPRGEENP